MMRIPLRIGVALVACVLGMGASVAQAERITMVGNAGTITLDWQATQDRAGRPLITGHVITYGGKSGYCSTRLLVETLDAQGRWLLRTWASSPAMSAATRTSISSCRYARRAWATAPALPRGTSAPAASRR